MEERRICTTVISEMLSKIPVEKTKLIEDLKWNLNDAAFKAPEDNIQWLRTMKTLDLHFQNPTEDWEYEVLSIFTTMSITDLKKMVDEV